MEKEEKMSYTRSIKNEIIRDLEKIEVRVKGIAMNAEFEAGARVMKEFIIKALKK